MLSLRRQINSNVGSITNKECLDILSQLSFKRKQIVNGKYIKEYEDQFAKYVGAKYAFSFGAGRMAFYAILKAMGIKEGDELLLPGYTCVVVPSAVIYCGAKPIYVDIDPSNFTIDVNKIGEEITSRTKAIVAQHLFASFCDMEAISKIANKYNLKVIEDCAHALGADYKGKKAGNFSDAAFFTTEQSKIITTWMGGMALTNDRKLAKKLQEIQNGTPFLEEKMIKKIVLQIVFYHIFGNPFTFFFGRYILWALRKVNLLISNVTPEEKMCKKPKNYPVRLSNVQAKIGLSQLRNIHSNIEHRRKIVKIYENKLRELGLKINRCDDKSYDPVHIRYTFLVKDREKLKKVFSENRIELGEWFNSVIHPKGSSLVNAYYEKGSCPTAEFVAEHSVNLPTHPKIRERDVDRIIEILRHFKALLFLEA